MDCSLCRVLSGEFRNAEKGFARMVARVVVTKWSHFTINCGVAMTDVRAYS